MLSKIKGPPSSMGALAAVAAERSRSPVSGRASQLSDDMLDDSQEQDNDSNNNNIISNNNNNNNILNNNNNNNNNNNDTKSLNLNSSSTTKVSGKKTQNELLEIVEIARLRRLSKESADSLASFIRWSFSHLDPSMQRLQESLYGLDAAERLAVLQATRGQQQQNRKSAARVGGGGNYLGNVVDRLHQQQQIQQQQQQQQQIELQRQAHLKSEQETTANDSNNNINNEELSLHLQQYLQQQTSLEDLCSSVGIEENNQLVLAAAIHKALTESVGANNDRQSHNNQHSHNQQDNNNSIINNNNNSNSNNNNNNNSNSNNNGNSNSNSNINDNCGSNEELSYHLQQFLQQQTSLEDLCSSVGIEENNQLVLAAAIHRALVDSVDGGATTNNAHSQPVASQLSQALNNSNSDQQQDTKRLNHTQQGSNVAQRQHEPLGVGLRQRRTYNTRAAMLSASGSSNNSNNNNNGGLITRQSAGTNSNNNNNSNSTSNNISNKAQQQRHAQAAAALSALASGTGSAGAAAHQHHHQSHSLHNHHHPHNQQQQQSQLSSSTPMIDFECDTCGSSFDDRHRLMQHQSIHLELKKDWFTETPVDEVMKIFNRRRGEFLCNTCNLRFEATFDYDKHNHLEHGPRPYCCQFCGNGTRTFRFWRQYLNHLYDHRYIFGCTIDDCDFTVNRRDSLRFHIFRFHLNCQLPQNNPTEPALNSKNHNHNSHSHLQQGVSPPSNPANSLMALQHHQQHLRNISTRSTNQSQAHLLMIEQQHQAAAAAAAVAAAAAHTNQQATNQMNNKWIEEDEDDDLDGDEMSVVE